MSEKLAYIGDSNRAMFMKSLFTPVTNPKGYRFFSAFLPQFIAPSASLAPLSIMFCYALLGARAIRLLKQTGAPWLEQTCALYWWRWRVRLRCC
ncbi:MAG: unnamed protein product [uncultured Caballeronia sp.]|nr:MAG: unnamed protein product [uncultured Caballeronia sp.]